MQYLYSILVLLILSSCHKDQCQNMYEDQSTFDTIYPNKYYPAYPGSSWTYNDSIKVKIEPDWMPFTVLKSEKIEQGCYLTSTNIVYAPKLDYKFLLGDKMCWTYNERYNNIDVLFGKVNSNWQSYDDPDLNYAYYGKGFLSGNKTYIKKYRRDSILQNLLVDGINYEDVLYINEKINVVTSSYSGSSGESNDLYYVKDIGLIRSIHNYYFNDYTFDSTYLKHDTLNLTAYFINA